MPITAAQTTAFFENVGQMGIPNATRVQLQTEGIIMIEDLAEFDDAELQVICDNLRRPSGRIPADPTDPHGAQVATPPFVFGAKSFMRLKAAAHAVRYYLATAREVTAANMRWTPYVKDFSIHWKSLQTRKGEDKPETPKITRTLPVVKWTEAFEDFLSRVIGTRCIPLYYVIRPDDVPPAVAALRVTNAYAEAYESVEEELTVRATHTHPLYRDDNAEVYYMLEEATRATAYAPSIKPFQRGKNGRGAYLAMIAQYAGEDKWRALIKSSEDLMHNRKWKGQSSNYSLEKFIAQHRSSFVTLSQCGTHVDYQLPNGTSRVTYLLSNIECNAAPLQAAMALIRNDNGAGGKMNDFESSASFLLPHDPVSQMRSSSDKKRAHADVSEVHADLSNDVTKKPRAGKTGVEFRFHTSKEYSKLTDEQRKELNDHRDTREAQGLSRNLPKIGGGKRQGKKVKFEKGGQSDSKKMKTMIAEAVATAIKDKSEKATADADVDKQFQEYIAAMVSSEAKNKGMSANAQASSANAVPPPAVSLNTILGRVQKK